MGLELTYTDTEVSVEESSMAKVIEIHYSGPSVIIDKTEDDVFLMGRNNKIIIFLYIMW